MNFLGSTTAAPASTPLGTLFQRNVESLIDNISVEINEVAVQNTIQRYNQLFKIIADYTLGDKQAQRSFLQNSVNVPSVAITVAALHVNMPMSMKNWLGWIESVQPRIIDTSVLGTVKIYIKLSGIDVLSKADNSQNGVNGSYSLNTINFNVDCIDVSDGLYYSMIQKQLETRPLELVFDNWITFEGGSQVHTSAATRFGLSI
jgi:hypothetical protein